METSQQRSGALGVVVVMYRSSDVIAACIRSLLAQRPAVGRIVLVDNCCPGGSVAAARDAVLDGGADLREVFPETASQPEEHCVEILHSDQNLGFAGGVNLGLSVLLTDPNCDNFWVLNPDCELAAGCANALVDAAALANRTGGFALLGSRILYHSAADGIQSDGGIYSRWTGRCRNLNQGRSKAQATAPESSEIDFVSGASMIASRCFVEWVGLMPERYFLYYEEVAWAKARCDLPLIMCHDAVVHHHGGTAIGSGALDRLPSPLSNYFNFRNRMRFMALYHPLALPIAYGFSLLKVIQTIAKGGWHSAIAAFCGMHALAPPAKVRSSFSQPEQAQAFSASRHLQHAAIPRDRQEPA